VLSSLVNLCFSEHFLSSVVMLCCQHLKDLKLADALPKRISTLREQIPREQITRGESSLKNGMLLISYL
jgi:hypothetical protein